MRRLFLLAALALGLAACGGSASSSQGALKITFGQSGGNMRPYSVTIAPGGAVTTDNSPGKPTSLTSAQAARLSRLVRDHFPGLKSEQCAGTFPDESSGFITALGKTVTVRGMCETEFTLLWNELMHAVNPSRLG